MKADTVSIYAVGDMIPDRPNPESLFEFALPTLQQADILFGQLEWPLSENGEPQLHMTKLPPREFVRPDRVSGLVTAGFDVISFASNHTLDRGEQALFETIETLTKNNIAVIGVGKNIEEARKPFVLERKGTRVAFLAYCSVLPKGFEARDDKSGAAPMRASTFYEQIDWQAGTPPRIITLADKNDLAAMVDDIKKVRPLADVVVVSLHWGVHFVPALIAMYQREVGHAAIDAGADLIVGHHAHILKGIEVYRGKVIFYSLCNFVMPASPMPAARGRTSLGVLLYGAKEDPEYAEYAFPVDSRKTIIARCTVSGKKIERVSYLPVMINKHAQPQVLSRSDTRSSEVLHYVEWCCQSQGLDTRFSWDGDEVVVAMG